MVSPVVSSQSETYFADSDSLAYKQGYAGAQYFNENPFVRGTKEYEDYSQGEEDFWVDWSKTGL